MASKTSIEWTDATWNPVTGCTKISAGCDRASKNVCVFISSVQFLMSERLVTIMTESTAAKINDPLKGLQLLRPQVVQVLPGRARLLISPVAIGSPAIMTMGMSRVAFFAA
jgi:hypothetical protein